VFKTAGYLDLYIESWRNKDGSNLSESQEKAKRIFFDSLKTNFGFTEDDLQCMRCPQERVEEWIPVSDEILSAFRKLAAIAQPDMDSDFSH
jgi:hypothetical protein